MSGVPREDLPGRTTPESVDDTTVEALGKLSEALETCERARGHLYTFHQLTGSSAIQLGGAVDALGKPGATVIVEGIDRAVGSRNGLPGQWTFQIMEEYDVTYWSLFRE